jgi:archaea-specific DNA-binding protein
MSAKSSIKRQSRTKEEEKGEEESSAQTEMRPAGMSTNHIYVGKKPVMNYAMSALIQLSQVGEVVIKARGLAISHAVDVAEIVTKRLGNGTFLVKNINITTEQVKSVETGEMRNVSSIEILVGK